MKNKITALFVATAGFTALDTASAAIYLAQTSTDEWAVSRNLSLISGTTASGSVTSSATLGILDVSKYTGGIELARVVIRVVQPDPVVSQTISASISIASGSDTFTSETAGNRVTERSLVYLSSTLETALDGVGVTVSNYDVTKNSGNYANAVITSGTPIAKSLNVSNGPVVLFDSDDEALTSAQLESIFAGVDTIGFRFDTTSDFRWARGGSEVLTANLEGTNSGQIIVEYYVIPEPSAALLGGLGFLCLLRRRR
jgi:hypothetical protein